MVRGAIVDQIIATLRTPHPDDKRLASIDMWGGPDAVRDVYLTGDDERVFRKAIIRIAAAMDQLKVGTERSRSIAKTFQKWLDEGL